MALTFDSVSIPAGPTWTNLFLSEDKGGTDGGGGIAGILIECASGKIEIQVDSIHGINDTVGGFIRSAGQSVPFTGKTSRVAPIKHVRARGVGGPAVITGGVFAH